ncbi:DUF2274 domain-containing protein [Frigoribacterium endophyticum]|uniref:DUF2274 domain-containing protein n=1 Tax=Frigoribacterium endophyticum TaxID=1522176 RepID=UPI00141FA535|nr:DUF2274 domain-containing protein [Frigoribacterium endophyticum]NII52166.1 hypothetical protein [Frigoribacterium endophyticum]
MTKAEELRARAARAKQRTASTTPEQSQPGGPAADATPAPRPNVIRAKPVRITADLSPQVYRGLIDYAAALAETQGRVRVAHVHVTRALVAELLENHELQGAIARCVRAQLDD